MLAFLTPSAEPQGACGHVVETEFRVLVTAAKQQQQPAQQAAAAQATATAGADANGESAASEDAAPSTEQVRAGVPSHLRRHAGMLPSPLL